MSTPPLVSILICSYNYERFVGATIDSALALRWPRTEVIVVDDGSTDGSWAVIQSYGSRIQAIRQPNGGQGAAYNRCFAHSRGDWVIFLDCDDLLDADCLTHGLAGVADDVNKVAFALRVIDAEGRPTGNVIPYTMHEGDVRDTLRRFGHYGGPPGSGNLYRRSAIAPYFPLDEDAWPMCADTVPYVVSAALGRVAAVREPQGSYRVHKRANKRLGLFGNVLGTLVETLSLDDRRRAAAMKLVAGVLAHDPAAELLPTPTQIRTRVISWKIDPAHHPYAGDGRRALLRLAWRSVRAWPGFGTIEQATLLTWALCVLVLPAALTPALVRLNASDAAKLQLRKVARAAARPTNPQR